MATVEEVRAADNANIRQGFDNLSRGVISGPQRAMFAYRNAQMQQLMQQMAYKSKINQLFQNLYQRDGQGNIVRDQNGLPIQDPNVVTQLNGALGVVDPSTVAASLQRAPGVYKKEDIEANTLQHQSPSTLAALFGPQPKTYNPSTGEAMIVPPSAAGVYSPAAPAASPNQELQSQTELRKPTIFNPSEGQQIIVPPGNPIAAPANPAAPSPNAALQSRTDLNKPTVFNPAEGQSVIVPPGSPISTQGGTQSGSQSPIANAFQTQLSPGGPTVLGGSNPKKLEELQKDLAELSSNDALLKQGLQNSGVASANNPYLVNASWNAWAPHFMGTGFADAAEAGLQAKGDPGAAARIDRLKAIFPNLGEAAHDITNRTTEKEIEMIRPSLPSNVAGKPIWDNYFKQGLAQNAVQEQLLQKAIQNGGITPALPPDQVHSLVVNAFKNQGLSPIGSDPNLYGANQQNAPVAPSTPPPTPTTPSPAALPPPAQRQIGMPHPKNPAYQWGKDDNGNLGWVPAQAAVLQSAPQTPTPGTDAAASTAP